MRVQTTVRNLRAGDILTGSGFTVEGVYVNGPKAEITGHYGSRAPIRKEWGASTTIVVERPTYQCLDRDCDLMHPQLVRDGLTVCGCCNGAVDGACCNGNGGLPCSGRTGKTFECERLAVGFDDDDEPMCAAHLGRS